MSVASRRFPPGVGLRLPAVQGGRGAMVSRATASAPAWGVGQCLGSRERGLMDEVGDHLVDTRPGALAARQEHEPMPERGSAAFCTSAGTT